MSDLNTLLSALKVVAVADLSADLIAPARAAVAKLKGNMTAINLAGTDAQLTGDAVEAGVTLAHDEAVATLDWLDAELGKLAAHAAVPAPTPAPAPSPPPAS